MPDDGIGAGRTHRLACRNLDRRGGKSILPYRDEVREKTDQDERIADEPLSVVTRWRRTPSLAK